MNLQELRAVQIDERGTTDIQPLPGSFYRDAAAYVSGLREERERAAERADDPFSSETVRRITDEIETAEEVIEAIYERRVGKVVKRASLAAAGMPADDEGLTAEETELFYDLVDLIEAHREEVLEALAGEREPAGETEPADAEGAPSDAGRAPADPTDAEPARGVPPEGPSGGAEPAREVPPEGPSSGAEPALGAGDAMGGSPEPDPGETEEPAATEPRSESGPESAPEPEPKAASGDGDESDDRVTVRITRDVGEIFGVDELTYDLAAEDVVTLPEENAKPLLDRDAAKHLF